MLVEMGVSGIDNLTKAFELASIAARKGRDSFRTVVCPGRHDPAVDTFPVSCLNVPADAQNVQDIFTIGSITIKYRNGTAASKIFPCRRK